jgi:hypothetical protein
MSETLHLLPSSAKKKTHQAMKKHTIKRQKIKGGGGDRLSVNEKKKINKNTGEYIHTI